jgi:hypothetical protein
MTIETLQRGGIKNSEMLQLCWSKAEAFVIALCKNLKTSFDAIGKLANAIAKAKKPRPSSALVGMRKKGQLEAMGKENRELSCRSWNEASLGPSTCF